MAEPIKNNGYYYFQAYEKNEIEKQQQTKIEAQKLEVADTFENLNINENLLKGIQAYGYEKLSEIQQKGILPLLKGKDTIIQTQSGTGKTSTLAIALLESINNSSNNPCQALVLVPTIESALYIQRVIRQLGQFLNVTVYTCTGNTNIEEDKNIFDQGVNCVIGTPDKIADMIWKKILKIDGLKMMFLDEADDIMQKGFSDQFQQIYESLPQNIQIGLFQDNFSQQVEELGKKIMKEPVQIQFQNENLTQKQFFIAIDKEQWKYETLLEFYNYFTVVQDAIPIKFYYETLVTLTEQYRSTIPIKYHTPSMLVKQLELHLAENLIDIQQCIIYVNTKQSINELGNQLKEQGFLISLLDSDISQEKSDLILKEFRIGQNKILISTDLLPRSIDIQQVPVVINYDFPISKDKYLHRIEKTGRFGKKGIVINFVLPSEQNLRKEIEKFYNTLIEELPDDVSIFL